MMHLWNQVGFAIQHAMQNPFGLEFTSSKSGDYAITLGSSLNCLGYNDYLEKTIGVARIALGLVALAFSKEVKDRLLSVAQVFRGILELQGNCEFYLLLADSAATVYFLARKILAKSEAKPEAKPTFAT